jgi:hypothetical protein
MKLPLKITEKEMATLVMMLDGFNTLIIEDNDIRMMVTAIMAPLYKRLVDRLFRLRSTIDPNSKRAYSLKLKPGEASALRYVLDRMHQSDRSKIEAIYEQSLRDRLLWDIDRWYVNQDHMYKYGS